MTGYLCPTCSTETTYAAFSGGREYYCPTCKDNGFYPEDEVTIKANLLRTPEGIERLRDEINAELERRVQRLHPDNFQEPPC